MKSSTKVSRIAVAREASLKNQMLLQVTRFIMEDDVFAHSVWDDLKVEYEGLHQNDAISRAAVSVMNSILTQERIYFAITRRSLEELMKTDKNHENRKGFKPTLYPAIIAFLTNELGLIEKVVDGTTRTANGYKVIDQSLLAYLERKIDKDTQLSEVKAFCEQGTKSGTKKDRKIESKKERNIETKKDMKEDSIESSRFLRTETAKTSIASGYSHAHMLPAFEQVANSSMDNNSIQTKHDDIQNPPKEKVALKRKGSAVLNFEVPRKAHAALNPNIKQDSTTQPKRLLDKKAFLFVKEMKSSAEQKAEQLSKYYWNDGQALSNAILLWYGKPEADVIIQKLNLPAPTKTWKKELLNS